MRYIKIPGNFTHKYFNRQLMSLNPLTNHIQCCLFPCLAGRRWTTVTRKKTHPLKVRMKNA